MHQATVEIFFVSLMLLKGGCRQRDPHRASDATQGHARSPPDIQLPERENEMSSVCERREASYVVVRVCVCLYVGEGTEQGGWGCCESRLMHWAEVSSRCTR